MSLFIYFLGSVVRWKSTLALLSPQTQIVIFNFRFYLAYISRFWTIDTILMFFRYLEFFIGGAYDFTISLFWSLTGLERRNSCFVFVWFLDLTEKCNQTK